MFSVNTETREIFLYDDIGPEYFGFIGAESVISALEMMKGQRVTVRINTQGGSVTEANAIHNAMKRHPGGVDTIVDSLAASAGSFIMLAGERRIIAKNASVMIHNPWTITFGNATEHRKTAEVLDKFGESLLTMYTDVMKATPEEINAMLEAETWFTAKEAVEIGLATEIGNMVSEPTTVAEGRFRNTPSALLRPAKPGTRNSAKNYATRLEIAKRR